MSGTVFKRCSRCGARVKKSKCRKCGSASISWAFRVYLGKNAEGRWIEQFRAGFSTKREAEHALLDIRSSLQRGTYVQASKMTLGDFLRDEWLVATAPPRVKYETWSDRKRNLEKHVIPRIGAVALRDLNAAHVNRLYTELMVDGRVDGAGGLSPTSVRRIHGMLRKALNDAVRWGLVRHNPVVLADPPPQKLVQAARRRSMRTWSEQELRQFLVATAGHYLHPMWAFAAATGVRRSELLGLRWSDLNLRARTVTVRQTLLAGEDDYELVEDHQKSTDSARTIHLDRRTVKMLIAHHEAQQRLREAAGAAWQDHDLIFPREDGSWWNPPAITLAFIRAVKRAGVPRIRLHDLRHTHASLLLAAGVNPKVVSERLGHSSVAFTLDTYAHVMPGMQPEAAELFMELVLGPDDHDDEDDEDDNEETA